MVPSEHNQSIRTYVEFYPTLDDFVHISLRIGEKASTTALTTLAYQLFLVVNAIGFPAFLLFSELYLLAVLLFITNLVLLFFIIPRVNSDAARNYYQRLMGTREKEIARVELSDAGILYTADEGVSFLPWRRITHMEETETSIYFYFEGNGFAIQKSGFPYVDEQLSFVNFAKTQVAGSHQSVIAE